MKFIFTIIMASILLLGCTDSKENPPATTNKINDNLGQITTRSVAQHYRIANTEKGEVNCIIDLHKKDSPSNKLRSGDDVTLVEEGEITVTIDGVIWLHVRADEDDQQQACYVQTLFLNPIAADYSPRDQEE